MRLLSLLLLLLCWIQCKQAANCIYFFILVKLANSVIFPIFFSIFILFSYKVHWIKEISHSMSNNNKNMFAIDEQYTKWKRGEKKSTRMRWIIVFDIGMFIKFHFDFFILFSSFVFANISHSILAIKSRQFYRIHADYFFKHGTKAKKITTPALRCTFHVRCMFVVFVICTLQFVTSCVFHFVDFVIWYSYLHGRMWFHLFYRRL